MDPNETLKMLRELVAQYITAKHITDWDTDDDTRVAQQMARADDIVERVEALDGWLSQGGFLPSGWKWPPDGEATTMPPR